MHDLEKVMELGSKNRSVGATLMNVDSSRSHSIFTIDLEMIDVEGEEGGLRAGRLNLVDLAGSERQSKTGSTGQIIQSSSLHVKKYFPYIQYSRSSLQCSTLIFKWFHAARSSWKYMYDRLILRRTLGHKCMSVGCDIAIVSCLWCTTVYNMENLS